MLLSVPIAMLTEVLIGRGTSRYVHLRRFSPINCHATEMVGPFAPWRERPADSPAVGIPARYRELMRLVRRAREAERLLDELNHCGMTERALHLPGSSAFAVRWWQRTVVSLPEVIESGFYPIGSCVMSGSTNTAGREVENHSASNRPPRA